MCREVLQRLQPGEGRQRPGGPQPQPDLGPLPLQVLPGLGLPAGVLLLQLLGEPGLLPLLLPHQAHHQAGPEVSPAVVRQSGPAHQPDSPHLLGSTDAGLPLPLSHQPASTGQLSLQNQLCSQHSQWRSWRCWRRCWWCWRCWRCWRRCWRRWWRWRPG